MPRPVLYAALLALVGAASGALARAVPAGALPRYGVLAYSNLCIEAESGDYAGERVTLIRSREGDSLLFEYGAGPLEGAFLADSLHVTAQDFTASAMTSDGRVELTGRPVGGRLRLDAHFGWARHDDLLPRVSDFAAPAPTCRS